MKYQSKLNLLKKIVSVSEEEELLKVFGDQLGFPAHLGDDPKLERVWLWQFPNHEVATIDTGNCTCRIIMVWEK